MAKVTQSKTVEWDDGVALTVIATWQIAGLSMDYNFHLETSDPDDVMKHVRRILLYKAFVEAEEGNL